MSDERKGTWIVLEGPDGAGKTTFARYLAGKLAEYVEDEGLIKAYVTPTHHVPGDVSRWTLGSIVRSAMGSDDMMTDMQDVSADVRCLLFLGDMIDLYRNHIKEDLEAGCVVIVDRWLPSTLIYHRAVYEQMHGAVLSSVAKRSAECVRDFYAWAGNCGEPDFVFMLHRELADRAVSIREKHNVVTDPEGRELDWYERQSGGFHARITDLYDEYWEEWMDVEGAGYHWLDMDIDKPLDVLFHARSLDVMAIMDQERPEWRTETSTGR